MKRIGCVALLMCIGCTVGDAGESDTAATASATIAPTDGNTVTGNAKFTANGGSVSVTITIANAAEGVHGLHIHQLGACGNAGMDAGGHWDGADAAGDPMEHGLPGGASHHIGDMGNITIAADGSGTLTTSSSEWTLGDNSATDVVGRAIIFHTNMDDGTMPSAGARQGCGVIAAD